MGLATKMTLRLLKKSAPDKTSEVLSAEASPDSKCPICLDRFNNMAYLDLCLHKFCFRCIHEWSKNKAECPLCKQPFNSIYHSIQSEKDFKKYDLRPTENGSFGSFAGERFRYRTTRALYRRGVRFFQRNPACLHRLLPWLKRELVVLYGAHGSLELQPFLQARTDHFLHEFVNFARAPFNMEAYDQHAVYDCPAPSSDEGSSSNSSVIAISEDEEGGDSVELDPVSGVALSQSTWDDETPGPSYSTTEPTRALLLSIIDSDSESSLGEECGAVSQPKAPRLTAGSARVKTDKDGPACTSSGDEDCIIVGFVKPLAERTPELVKLSSDSEESVLEESKDEVPRLLQHIRFTSLSPASSQGQCPGRAEGMEREQDVSCSKERRNTSPSIRRETSSKSTSKNSGQTEKDGRRCQSRDRSRERPRSRSRDRRRRSRSADRSRSTKSPAISINSDSTLSRGRRQSRSQSRDRSHTKGEKKRDNKDGRRSGRSHDSSSHSYHWHYYSRESERDSSATLYTERRTYYSSSHRNIDCRSPSQSQSPDSHRRDKRRSRSRSSTCSPSGAHRKSRHEKPSGKRKYKSRHLEEPDPKDKSSNALDEPPSSTTSSCAKDKKKKKKSKEKRHRRSKEKSGGKRSRSLSVEIIYEGSSSEQTRKHQKKKKKHKKKGKRHRSKERTGSGKHSPTVITIDSDSDQHTAAGANDANHTCPVSSSTSNYVLVPSTTTTTGNPADSGLLESMLQGWEQQIPPVGLDSGVLEVKPPLTAAATDTPTHSEGVLSQSASADEVNSHSPSNDNTSHFLQES
uniref:E3 ubiquitin-protein ligase Topors n=1 Tax=Salmo trutta TaxID=8032 RepID=A0A673Y0M6_SALTR